jgi:hypothetical protein
MFMCAQVSGRTRRRAVSRRSVGRVPSWVVLGALILSVCTGQWSGEGVSVTEADNGKTVTVHVLQPVQVTLEPATWRFAEPSSTSVLSQRPQSVSRGPRTCQVEFQCGRVSVQVWPLKSGVAAITAYLTYCGEARSCDLSKVAFRVTIHVVP